MSAKTVFISYRRDPTGKAFGRLLKQELTRNGYDVFLDVDSIDSGKWAEQILTQVPVRSHFLLLLTPHAIDRCVDENDWVKLEFETAVQSGRNIVPVREESVDLTKLRQDCPDAMKGLFDLQIATVRQDGFEHDIEDLIERYIPPHRAPQAKKTEQVECIVSTTRLLRGADHLFGREQELSALDQVWNDPSKKVLTIVAFGGVGKTSLVIEWMARQAAKNWAGFERVFDWSFFSQGTREEGGASADTFVAAALRFFGDEAMAESAASAWDKGARLAQLVRQQRSLLVLDGIEPLQHPPGPLAGELKDPALATLLKGLARQNSGLCIVTTRERVTDLAAFRDTTAPEWELHHLATTGGVELLKNLGVHGTSAEFEAVVKEISGHALTLNLLGRYLAKAHQGDIRKRDQVKFEKADEKIQGGYAFKTIGAYERWLAEGGEDGAGSLAILRLLGLFDRPADVSCLNALRCVPSIKGLTELLIGLDEADWNIAVNSLVECGLVSVQSDESAIDNSRQEMDAHPLVREYFAKQLREKNPEAWRAAHSRLFEHLRATAPDKEEPTLEDLQPLYQAVAHGCQAGLQQEACDYVYFTRILQQYAQYSWKKLGAYGSDLGAVACFFEQPWSRLSTSLKETAQSFLMNQAAIYLRALGRLTEAIEPMRVSGEMDVRVGEWKGAAISYSNLSELKLALGEVADAVRYAEKSVTYAARSGNVFLQLGCRATHADALHQAGRGTEAEARFQQAEQMQADSQPDYPLLYSMLGFRYCDLLLTKPERAAWQLTLNSLIPHSSSLSESCLAVAERATKTHEWAEAARVSLLDTATNYLTLGRVALYSAILEARQGPGPAGTAQALQRSDPIARGFIAARQELDAAVDRLRGAGAQHHIPHGFLTRAWLRFLTGARMGPESAQADLDEAWEIAERGPMRLFMADIHLYRARLFGPVSGKKVSEAEAIEYPWNKSPDGSARGPLDDLAAARKLIEQCGYWRRKEELEDAEVASKSW